MSRATAPPTNVERRAYGSCPALEIRSHIWHNKTADPATERARRQSRGKEPLA
jgi:hypothetical protein